MEENWFCEINLPAGYTRLYETIMGTCMHNVIDFDVDFQAAVLGWFGNGLLLFFLMAVHDSALKCRENKPVSTKTIFVASTSYDCMYTRCRGIGKKNKLKCNFAVFRKLSCCFSAFSE